MIIKNSFHLENLVFAEKRRVFFSWASPSLVGKVSCAGKYKKFLLAEIRIIFFYFALGFGKPARQTKSTRVIPGYKIFFYSMLNQ